ncbi:hypothetical protein ACTXT7_006611 [Hymenolepis weldensis]
MRLEFRALRLAAFYLPVYLQKYKALSAKFEGAKHVDPTVTSMSSVPSSYSIKPFASVEIPDHAAAEDIIKNILQFFHNSKSGKFFESWYKKNKYVFTVNFVKWDEKKRVSYLVRKLDPVECERDLKFVLLKNSMDSVIPRLCRSWKKFLARTYFSSQRPLQLLQIDLNIRCHFKQYHRKQCRKVGTKEDFANRGPQNSRIVQEQDQDYSRTKLTFHKKIPALHPKAKMSQTEPYNHNLKEDVEIIGSSKTKTSPPICNQCLQRICLIDSKTEL